MTERISPQLCPASKPLVVSVVGSIMDGDERARMSEQEISEGVT